MSDADWATGPPAPSRLPLPPPPQQFHASLVSVRLLVVVEGAFDIHFLRRIGRVLHHDDPRVPDLEAWERSGELIFVPIAGGNIAAWCQRFAGMGLPEFHLYDREIEPETTLRRNAIDLVNSRRGCLAVLTGKRQLENYLHPAAIREARGIELRFGDDDDVPGLAARSCYELRGDAVPWNALVPRTRKRLRDRAKRWLNTWAVERMTVRWLAERDPAGELRGWHEAIAELAGITTFYKETT